MTSTVPLHGSSWTTIWSEGERPIACGGAAAIVPIAALCLACVERRHNAVGDLVTVSEATVKVRIDGETMLSVGEGNGPVNALDTALRKDLGRYQSFISDLELVDYKVRILTGGTDAVTRVLIESRDG